MVKRSWDRVEGAMDQKDEISLRKAQNPDINYLMQ